MVKFLLIGFDKILETVKECVREIDRAIVLLFGVALALAVSGCGHNAIQYGDGVGFDFGINPENWTCSFTLRYGKILSACVRENTELEITGGNDTTGNGGEKSSGGAIVKTESSVKVKVGKQITGYYVDAIKAGAKPEEVDKYTDGDAAKPEAAAKTEAVTPTATK